MLVFLGETFALSAKGVRRARQVLVRVREVKLLKERGRAVRKWFRSQQRRIADHMHRHRFKGRSRRGDG